MPEFEDTRTLRLYLHRASEAATRAKHEADRLSRYSRGGSEAKTIHGAVEMIAASIHALAGAEDALDAQWPHSQRAGRS